MDSERQRERAPMAHLGKSRASNYRNKKPRITEDAGAEKPRRSLTFLPLSPLSLIDGLARTSLSYDKLPDEPLKLSVLKLDASSFQIEVAKTASVAELKLAVEAVFAHLPQHSPGNISWPHVWGHFCLCYDGRKLMADSEFIRDYGIKDGDQLRFAKHVSATNKLIKKQTKKKNGFALSKPKNVCDVEDQREKEPRSCNGREKMAKLGHYVDQGCFSGRNETGLSRLLKERFSHRNTIAGRRRAERLACPAKATTGFFRGFKKALQRCGEKWQLGSETRFRVRDT